MITLLLVVCLGQHPRLVSEETHRSSLWLLPATTDPSLTELYRRHDDFVFYDDKTMPRSWQASPDDAIPGVHAAGYDISGGDDFKKVGNARADSPWKDPAGAAKAKNARTRRFFVLPRQEDGRFWPIVYWKERKRPEPVRNQQGQMNYPANLRPLEVWRWTYPAGTNFCEIGIVVGPDGRERSFQLNRLERKLDGWEPAVYRRLLSPNDLVERLLTLRGENDPVTARVATFYGQWRQLPIDEEIVKHPGRVVFAGRGIRDTLPELPVEVVNAILDTTPVRAVTHPWITVDQEVGWAPVCTGYNIVPAGLSAHVLAVTRQACAQCHSDAGANVDQFDIKRQWYGLIPGGDGILSAEQWDPSCVSPNGNAKKVYPYAKMVAQGLLEERDDSRHPLSIYRPTQRSVP